MAAPHAAPSLPLGLVEVPAAPARPQPAVATQLELSRADGTRLCLPTPLSPLLLDALVRAFVEGRACCNGPPHSRILLATQPVDCRTGIDGLAAVCRQGLGENPLEGAIYVFRNRAGTALKLLLYDGQGYWWLMKRLSQGRFTWWPTTPDARVSLSARELLIVLWNGNPARAQMARDWRRVASGEARLRA